jgi:hypothetical protein
VGQRQRSGGVGARAYPSTVLEAYENRGNTAVAAAAVAELVVAAVVEAEAEPKRRTRKRATAEG